MGLVSLVLDKETFPRYKPCGGGLSRHALSYLDFKLPSSLVLKEIRGARIHFKGEKVECRRDIPVVCTTSRASLDKLLLEKAKDAGAIVKTGERAIDISSGDKCVKVQTDHGLYKSKYGMCLAPLNSSIDASFNQ